MGGSGTTGCKQIVPGGWSYRLMWYRDGLLNMYLYHQDRPGRCGEYVESTVKFQKEVWYNISMYMRLNEPYSSDNGYASLSVNGVKVAEKADIRWRGQNGALIDTFGLSTFYGG